MTDDEPVWVSVPERSGSLARCEVPLDELVRTELANADDEAEAVRRAVAGLLRRLVARQVLSVADVADMLHVRGLREESNLDR